LKIVLFPDLFVRAEVKMLTYFHTCSAFYFHPSSTSEKNPDFQAHLKKTHIPLIKKTDKPDEGISGSPSGDPDLD
jgi:hypothetical protein